MGMVLRTEKSILTESALMWSTFATGCPDKLCDLHLSFAYPKHRPEPAQGTQLWLTLPEPFCNSVTILHVHAHRRVKQQHYAGGNSFTMGYKNTEAGNILSSVGRR